MSERRKRQGPLTLLIASKPLQRRLTVAAIAVGLYVASSGPARSFLIHDKLLSVYENSDGALVYRSRRYDSWSLPYAPLKLCRRGPAGGMFEAYWELFPVRSDLPDDLR